MGKPIRRVVMVTPDLQIDRRILLEAQSLRAAGKEVILIAANDGKQPESEILDDVKLLRPLFNGVDTRFTFVDVLQSKMIGAINWLSLALNKLTNLAASGSSHFFNLLATCFSRVFGVIITVLTRVIGWIALVFQTVIRWLALGVHYTIVLFAKFNNLMIHWIARGVNFSFRACLRSLQLLSRKTAYDRFIEQNVRFFRGDVVHAHDLPVLKGAVLAARQNKAYCIYDAHELYIEEDFPKYIRWSLKNKEYWCLKRVDWTVTVNHFIADEIRRRYRIEKIEVVENCTKRPMGFDPETQRYDLFRKEYSLSSEARLLLYQGWFAPTRNLATLVQGMAHLDNRYYLLMMGYGDYAKELKKIAKDCRVDPHVIFVPAKSQAELLYYTASADVGLMPYSGRTNLNTLYSSPNKMYEFIAAGLPILANRLPYYEEVIGRYGNGLVADLNTPEAFAQAVKQLFDQGLADLRRRSLQAYCGLNWDHEAEKLLKIYTTLETAFPEA
jgi:glycosyltransferase involved in cell wall biosynthesis